jgi:GDP-L-fucose synthase
VNVLDAARKVDVERLLFLGSSCIYPKLAAQPIREESLLCGPLEPTNDAYAIAKIAGILHVQAVRRGSRPCPPTSTDRTTISRRRGLMFCPH